MPVGSGDPNTSVITFKESVSIRDVGSKGTGNGFLHVVTVRHHLTLQTKITPRSFELDPEISWGTDWGMSAVTVHCTGYGKNKDLNEKFWRCARNR